MYCRKHTETHTSSKGWRAPLAYLLWGVAGPDPVIHDDALVMRAFPKVSLVPFRAYLVKIFRLIRKHHIVYRLFSREDPIKTHAYRHKAVGNLCACDNPASGQRAGQSEDKRRSETERSGAQTVASICIRGPTWRVPKPPPIGSSALGRHKSKGNMITQNKTLHRLPLEPPCAQS